MVDRSYSSIVASSKEKSCNNLIISAVNTKHGLGNIFKSEAIKTTQASKIGKIFNSVKVDKPQGKEFIKKITTCFQIKISNRYEPLNNKKSFY